MARTATKTTPEQRAKWNAAYKAKKAAREAQAAAEANANVWKAPPVPNTKINPHRATVAASTAAEVAAVKPEKIKKVKLASTGMLRLAYRGRHPAGEPYFYVNPDHVVSLAHRTLFKAGGDEHLTIVRYGEDDDAYYETPTTVRDILAQLKAMR